MKSFIGWFTFRLIPGSEGRRGLRNDSNPPINVALLNCPRGAQLGCDLAGRVLAQCCSDQGSGKRQSALDLSLDSTLVPRGGRDKHDFKGTISRGCGKHAERAVAWRRRGICAGLGVTQSAKAESRSAVKSRLLAGFRLGGKFQVLRVQTQIIVAQVHRVAAVMRRSFQTCDVIPKASALGSAVVMIRRRGRGSRGRPLAVMLRGLGVCHRSG